MTKRIVWTNEEKKAVAHRYHEQRAKGAKKGDAIKAAQRCLPAGRRRSFGSSGTVSVACAQLDHRRRANGSPSERLFRPPLLLESLNRFNIASLVDGVADKITHAIVLRVSERLAGVPLSKSTALEIAVNIEEKIQHGKRT